MALQVLPTSFKQTRTISDQALSTQLGETLSEEVINRIRWIALGKLDEAPDPTVYKLNGEFKVSLASDLVAEVLEKSIEKIKQISNLYTTRKDLFQQAEAELREYYKSKTTVTAPWKELEAMKSFRDTRLTDWANLAQVRFIVSSERKRGTAEFRVEKQEISCYRYAVTEAGIEVNGILDEKKLNLILSDFEQVLEPQDGDLILFSKWERPTHLGIYREGKILSKEGNGSPYAYLRVLEDLSPSYGDQFTIYRPVDQNTIVTLKEQLKMVKIGHAL